MGATLQIWQLGSVKVPKVANFYGGENQRAAKAKKLHIQNNQGTRPLDSSKRLHQLRVR
jgi:hypothetical protein